MLPSSYDNGTQIVQAPGFVTILHEKIHEARIIPLDQRAHVGNGIRSYLGDSRGHWEGDPLVVDTTNLIRQISGGTAATRYRRATPFISSNASPGLTLARCTMN
jgi:hypothetical protein